MSDANGMTVSKYQRSTFSTPRACAIMMLTGVAIAGVLPFNVSAFRLMPTNRIALPKAKTNGGRFPCSAPKLAGSMAPQDINDRSMDTTPIVDELLELVERKKENEENPDEDATRELIAKLSSNADDYILDEKSSSSLFEPLVGYYNVSCTLTSRPNDNPVGGKWTRGLWTVKRTMQHVLPPLPLVPSQTKDSDDESFSVASKAVAQVVNAIRLELLWGFVSVWVLLRGDAVPLKLDPMYTESKDTSATDDSKKEGMKLLPNLSDRTVKAYFDRPRIGVSLRSRKNSSPFQRVLTLGPTSAVILDTPYADNRIRLGKGGTSGSQFVFSRLAETDKEASDGWKWVLDENSKSIGRSLTKKALVLRLGLTGFGINILSRIAQQRCMRFIAGAYALISVVSIFGLIRSTGGIETDGDTYMKGKP